MQLISHMSKLYTRFLSIVNHNVCEILQNCKGLIIIAFLTNIFLDAKYLIQRIQSKWVCICNYFLSIHLKITAYSQFIKNEETTLLWMSFYLELYANQFCYSFSKKVESL